MPTNHQITQHTKNVKVQENRRVKITDERFLVEDAFYWLKMINEETLTIGRWDSKTFRSFEVCGSDEIVRMGRDVEYAIVVSPLGLDSNEEVFQKEQT